MSQPQTIGRYQIVAVLGHGAMGAVYQAHDPKMERSVAIKTILSTALSGPLAEEYRERFVREARAAGRLTHPGVVMVYDVGEENDIPYLVMEYVNGRSLATAMGSGERFSFEQIYEIGFQVADALGYAHRHGVVHRDVKPANILLAIPAPGEIERTKIADLGVAKLAASQITTTGQLLGTPAFMAPEQFTGGAVDGRADLFSLGVILYWLATGDKPFGGDTITAVSYKIVNVEPPPPRRINPAVPQPLERIIVRCLEKDPAARYSSGEALAADLAAARTGQEPGQSSAAGLAGLVTASGRIMAPAMNAGMSGDPNTTLDSDVRLQMAAAARQRAVPAQPPPRATPHPWEQFAWSRLNVHEQKLIGISGAVLLAMLLIWGVNHHRRSVAAERQAEAQRDLAAQVDKADLQRELQPAQPPVSAASDQNATQTGAPANSNAGAAQSAYTTAANPPGSTVASNGAPEPVKKTTPKLKLPPAKSAPPKADANNAGTAADSASTVNANSATAATTPPVEQSTPPTPVNTPPAEATAPAPKPVTPPVAADAADAGKLHIDDGRLPNSVSFTVLMDGQVLFQRGILPEGQDHPTREDLLIPPGNHELRVIAAEGTIAIGDSNTVRQEFKAKKKKNLRIEMRDNSSGQTIKKSGKVEPNSAIFNIELKDAGGFLGVH
ncbi:MAG TPA: protein kinase [Candidatus Acidoferrales bacterium]|nr:protein kinase [Candidatus Acidoferrales bacterium]